jgi:excinuclease ABC subunit C
MVVKRTEHSREDFSTAFPAIFHPVTALSGRRITSSLHTFRTAYLPLKDKQEFKAQFKAQCRPRPGIYGMVDSHGKVIYIGKSKNLRSRLSSYLRAKEVSEKACRILLQADSLLWEELPDEFGCLLREVELIELLRPKYNVRDNPNRKRVVFLCLGRSPAAYFFLSRHRPADCITAVGPLLHSFRTKRAVDILNNLYKLRDCPKSQTLHFSDQRCLWKNEVRPGCHRLELRRCLGPCARGCSKEEYIQMVRRATEFFQDDGVASIELLTKQMEEAIENLQFEQAQVIHEEVSLLENLREELREARVQKKRLTFVYEVHGQGGMAHWYAIQGGRVLFIHPLKAEPSDREKFGILLDELCQRHGPYLTGLSIENVSLVASWFRKFPKELERTMSFEQARRILRERLEPNTRKAGSSSVS